MNKPNINSLLFNNMPLNHEPDWSQYSTVEYRPCYTEPESDGGIAVFNCQPGDEQDVEFYTIYGRNIHTNEWEALTDVPDVNMAVSVIRIFRHMIEQNAFEFNQARAENEGWCISQCFGSSYFPEGWYNLERLDTMSVFKSDWDAQAFVAGCAAQGSEYHKRAIMWREQRNFELING